MDVSLTDEQLEAARILLDRIDRGERVSVLAGAAGVGKTTLMRHLDEELIGRGCFMLYGAPTGKAASRLSQVIGSPVSTLHSLFYGRVAETDSGRPLFLDLRQKMTEARHGVILVDESSMIGEHLARDVEKACGDSMQILYAGDHCQLQPVADRPGVDLQHPHALLDTVHRQALDNPVLAVATDVRRGRPLPQGKVGDAYERRRGSVVEAANWLAERRIAGADAAVICLRNRIRKAVNTSVRRILGMSDEPLVPGDELLILLNNRCAEVANGETFTVDLVERYPGKLGEAGLVWVESGQRRYLVHEPSIGAEMSAFKKIKASLSLAIPTGNLVHVDYGYSLTSWKSQGSEFQEVCFLIDDFSKGRMASSPSGREESRRVAYTSITRAKRSALVLDVA